LHREAIRKYNGEETGAQVFLRDYAPQAAAIRNAAAEMVVSMWAISWRTLRL